MITESHLLENLNELDRLYNGATNKANDNGATNKANAKQPIYYSKLALLELCGWIEESMDDIILQYSNSKLKEDKNKKYLEDRIIRPNYGFSYDKDFREMLVKTIGIIQLEKLETKLEKHGTVTKLRSALNSLKSNRNTAAHTFSKEGVTTTYDAPSKTRENFLAIYELLKIFEREIKQLK
jgi:hypothetical protein